MPFGQQKATKETSFCVPAIDVVGVAKCGTSAAYELLSLHHEILAASKRKELCMTRLDGGVWEWIEWLEPRVHQDTSSLLVNGCADGPHTTHQEILFRLYERPSAKVFVVRGLPDLLWSAYNYWCDPLREADCSGPCWSILGEHPRSPESYEELLRRSQELGVESFRNAPPPSVMQSYFTNMFARVEALSPIALVVYAKEMLETDPTTVWKRIAAKIEEVYGRRLTPHTELQRFTEVLVNTNDHKGVKTETPISAMVEGTYEISGMRPMLEASRRFIMQNWAECHFWANRTGYDYPCAAS
eukprot:scaffold1239_cov175-Pinguiococcus_pyrenoidosus.AAC.31